MNNGTLHCVEIGVIRSKRSMAIMGEGPWLKWPLFRNSTKILMSTQLCSLEHGLSVFRLLFIIKISLRCMIAGFSSLWSKTGRCQHACQLVSLFDSLSSRLAAARNIQIIRFSRQIAHFSRVATVFYSDPKQTGVVSAKLSSTSNCSSLRFRIQSVCVSRVDCGLDVMIDFAFQQALLGTIRAMAAVLVESAGKSSWATPQSQQMAHCANRISSQVQRCLMSINYQIVAHQSALVAYSCCCWCCSSCCSVQSPQNVSAVDPDRPSDWQTTSQDDIIDILANPVLVSQIPCGQVGVWFHKLALRGSCIYSILSGK